MTCEEAREGILDAAAGEHLAGCERCRRFHAVQRSLDERLTRAYTPPPLDPRIRVAIRARVKAEKQRRLWEVLPGVIAPAASLAMAGVCALLIPELARLVLTAGVAGSLLSYGGQLLFTWLTEELGEG